MRDEVTKFLFVDDDIVSLERFKRFLNKAGIENLVVSAVDGIEALDILRGHGDHEKLHHPFLVILDLSMPRMNGIEFLDVVRNDPDLKGIVVYIMTTSDSQSDIDAALQGGADGFFMKDQADVGFMQAIVKSKALSDQMVKRPAGT